MITVTRLNGSKITINALLLETIEETPDTVVTLTTGKKMIVKESTAELQQLAVKYLSSIGVFAAVQKSGQMEDPSL